MDKFPLGTTVRLVALFRDWADAVVAPTLVNVVIYDSKWQKLEEHSVGIGSRLETGEYYYDYTLPAFGTYRTKEMHIEWNAEIDGTVSLRRYDLLLE